MTANARGRKNVLLILTEDHGAQMGMLGTKGLKTPHMDSIAAQGVSFTSHYVTYPVCSPSKAAMYTGLYPHANGCRCLCSNHPPGASPTPEQMNHPAYTRPQVHEEIPTLIELLQDAGYYTGVSMKLHVVPVDKFPYDEFVVGSKITLGEHGGNADRENTAEFIRHAQDRDSPWFLCYTISQPHRPFRNSDVDPITVDPAEVEIPPFLPDTPVVRKDWAEYLDCIECADVFVGEALAALEETGCREDTLVIFVADHGPAYQRAKMTLYDFGLRVPLAIMGPGIPEGRVIDDLVSQIDLMPTILEWAGIERPELQHGLSLWPLLRGDVNAQGHQYVFGEIHHDYIYFPPNVDVASASAMLEGGPQDPGMQERSVFDGRYHLIYRENLDQPRDVNSDITDWDIWLNRAWDETVARKEEFPLHYEMIRQQDPMRLGGRLPGLEFYDLEVDPHEMTNLADSPEHAGAVERLRESLRRWALETGDTYIALGSADDG